MCFSHDELWAPGLTNITAWEWKSISMWKSSISFLKGEKRVIFDRGTPTPYSMTA